MTTPPDRPRVLVAEDDEGTLKLLRTLLRRRRVHVELARDGREAIEALSASQWDALILDMMMPVVSGWDVAEWLARHPERRPRSVVVVSGAERSSIAAVDPSAVNAIIFKPFDIDHMTDYIISVVRQKRGDRRKKRIVEEATARL